MCVALNYSLQKSSSIIADKAIRGPIGMRTLDPSDWNYRPYYENSIDNDDLLLQRVEIIIKDQNGFGILDIS